MFWAGAGERLFYLGDRTPLLAAFVSAGRRRSEVATMWVEELVDDEVSDRAHLNDMAPLPFLPLDRTRPHQDSTSVDDETST
ncbi:hypothetical protein FQZ97_811490 [compost metagenome]